MEDKKVNQEKWGAKLLEYTLKAVENVRPSSRYMSDSMVFNQFIKIKLINWEDSSKSAYINGLVISKNLADKRMRTDVDNPQILLLKESISTTVRTVVAGGEQAGAGGAGLTEIQSIVNQEEHWIGIIKSKLTQVRPNIVIVEKDIGYKILDVLREEGIIVITSLDHHKMKRFQRYTQTIISPSYNVIDKSFVLGKCKKFRVESPYTGASH